MSTTWFDLTGLFCGYRNFIHENRPLERLGLQDFVNLGSRVFQSYPDTVASSVHSDRAQEDKWKEKIEKREK